MGNTKVNEKLIYCVLMSQKGNAVDTKGGYRRDCQLIYTNEEKRLPLNFNG